MKRAFVWLVLAAGLLTGCSRVAATTTIAPDGSFTRQVVYSASNNNGPQNPADLTKFFVVPGPAAGLTIESVPDKIAKRVSVTRHVAPDQPPLEDISLKATDGKVIAVSRVSVHKLQNGNLEYEETVHCNLPPGNPFKDMPASIRQTIKKGLPTTHTFTTAEIDRICDAFVTSVFSTMFGPPEPAVADFLLNTDLAELKLRGSLPKAFDSALRSSVPNLDAKERAAASSKIAQALVLSTFLTDPTPQNSGNINGFQLTPALFEVAFPGTLVETNGLTEPVSGHVYWSISDVAAALGDLRLYVICKP